MRFEDLSEDVQGACLRIWKRYRNGAPEQPCYALPEVGTIEGSPIAPPDNVEELLRDLVL